MAATIFIAKIGSSLRVNLPMEQERTMRMAEIETAALMSL